MNKKTLLMISLAWAMLFAFSSCQKDENDIDDEPSWITNFDEHTLAPETFWNGSDGSGGFTSGPLFYPNAFNTEWFSWSGFALSNITDNQTPGWDNQYSSITGGGFNGNAQYAIVYVSGADETNAIRFTDENKGKVLQAIYVSNTTYTALSMLNGDAYSKKFGGESGNDDDWFLLTINGVKNGEVQESNPVTFFLADYRFSDNAKNYVVDDWTRIDLTSLGEVDEIRFSLSSSDIGDWGMNTPSYFAIGRVEVK